MRSALVIAALMLCVLSCGGNDKTTHPSQTIEGSWDLIGYADHGVSGVTTGSARFLNDGTFLILGTVTYPGEPLDSLNVFGTYDVLGAILTLTTTDGTGAWSMVFSSNQVVLTLAGSAPPTTMTLQRQ